MATFHLILPKTILIQARAAWNDGVTPARHLKPTRGRKGGNCITLDADQYFINSRIMESFFVVRRLSALAQESRLAVFRLLIKAGPGGMAAGEIARALGLTPNTLSTQLTILSNAELVTSRRAGRSIIYAADYGGMSELLLYLMEDCCQGRAEVCAPIAQIAARGACCDHPQGKLS